MTTTVLGNKLPFTQGLQGSKKYHCQTIILNYFPCLFHGF